VPVVEYGDREVVKEVPVVEDRDREVVKEVPVVEYRDREVVKEADKVEYLDREVVKEVRKEVHDQSVLTQIKSKESEMAVLQRELASMQVTLESVRAQKAQIEYRDRITTKEVSPHSNGADDVSDVAAFFTPQLCVSAVRSCGSHNLITLFHTHEW